MKDLSGKFAFVTGAASGIGRGIARNLAKEGVHLALADINPGPLEEVRAEIAHSGVRTLAVPLDVSDRAAAYRAAETVEHEFGKIHIVCNNAGVGYSAPVDRIPDEDFDWVMAVNVDGVFNGIKAFVPKLKKHGEGGHIVNTASVAGLRMAMGWNNGLYVASKMAVVALTEGLRQSLEGENIGVSVLCPQAVNTNIYNASNVRPQRFGGPVKREAPGLAEMLKGGLSGEEAGVFVVDAIKTGEFFILTHPDFRFAVEEWHQYIMKGFDRAEATADRLGLRRPPQL